MAGRSRFQRVFQGLRSWSAEQAGDFRRGAAAVGRSRLAGLLTLALLFLVAFGLSASWVAAVPLSIALGWVLAPWAAWLAVTLFAFAFCPDVRVGSRGGAG